MVCGGVVVTLCSQMISPFLGHVLGTNRPAFNEDGSDTFGCP